MTLPSSDTVVLYPAGDTTAHARVVHAEPFDDAVVLVLDRTCAHPVDTAWPDQGPDRGVLRSGGTEVALRDVVVGATDGTDLYLGEAVPVKKGADGWSFVVAHVVDASFPAREGDDVEVHVDAAHRLALSAGHTGCHLASLALDAALAGAWSKDVPADALGAPGFDALACASSRILEYGSRDEYRIGKSLRRRGFRVDALADPAALEREMNTTLARWVDASADVRIDAAGSGLTDRREWVCALPEGEARIPCGGTHVDSLGVLGGVSVALVAEEAEGALGLVMTTSVLPPS